MPENTETPKPNLNRKVINSEYDFVNLMKERGVTREEVSKFVFGRSPLQHRKQCWNGLITALCARMRLVKPYKMYFELPPTEDTLCKLLQLFDLEFTIDKFRVEPFMLPLHIHNDGGLTVIEIGDNEDEARALVLKRTFEILRVLMLEVK